MGMKISRFVQKPVPLQAAAGLNGQDPAGPPGAGRALLPEGCWLSGSEEERVWALPFLSWSSFLGQTARCGRRVISQA